MCYCEDAAARAMSMMWDGAPNKHVGSKRKKNQLQFITGNVWLFWVHLNQKLLWCVGCYAQEVGPFQLQKYPRWKSKIVESYVYV